MQIKVRLSQHFFYVCQNFLLKLNFYNQILILNKNKYGYTEFFGCTLHNVNLIDENNIKNAHKGELLVVKNHEKDYLIPYNFDIILSINIKEKRIDIQNIKGLID